MIAATQPSFFAALRVQVRVIRALFMWEVITRFGRDNLGFIWLFLEPMLFTLCVTGLWYAVGLAHNSGLPVVAFALTGYSSVLLWRNCATRCSMAVPANRALLFHRPVQPIDILITRILMEVAGATISFLSLSILWIAIGWADFPDDFLLVVAGWLLLIWFATALALIVGAATSISEIAERFWHPVGYILFPLSGAIFMVDWLVDGFKQAVLWFPMVHCVEMMRAGFFGSVVRTYYDPEYVVIVCMVMTVIGLALTRIASREVRFGDINR